MNLEHLANYLEEQGLGSIGKSIFVNSMPADTFNGILFMPPYYGVPIDHELPDYETAEYRIVVRSTEVKRGLDLTNAASAALTIRGDTQIGDLLVKLSLPMNRPRPYARSAGAYWEFEVDVITKYVHNP